MRFVNKIFFIIAVISLSLIVFSTELQELDSNFVFTESINSKKIFENYNSLVKEIKKLSENGIEITRFVDELETIKEFYYSAQKREKDNNIIEYSLVEKKLLELKMLVEIAVQLNDELIVLKDEINALDPNLNNTKIKTSYENALKEFKDLRYEKAKEAIKQTYHEISDAQSIQSRTNAMYLAASSGIKGFLEKNWINIVIAIIFIILAYIIFGKKIKIFLMKAKIKEYELKLVSLKKGIEKAQEDYFKDGKIAESDYKIKINVYANKMREIIREIAVLEEELKKLEKGSKNNKEKNN